MPLSWGLEKLLHDLRYRRDHFRQFIGVSFVIFVSLAGRPNDLLFLLGAPFVLLGIAVRLWASGHIKKNKALATDGPYAYVRHPIYVGNITLGFGFCLASGLWWSFPLFLAILLIFYPQAIRNEDVKLHHRFKEDWEQWNKRTRALIPRFTPQQQNQRGSWSFMESLRHNGEPMIALFLLFWFYILSLWLP
jgi:protein-S-isoprenylcysteine O-methyltransferase Ste14